jgi:hypothetical protein
MELKAKDVMAGRFEYYIESATDQDMDRESLQAFALEFFATTVLPIDDVQEALNGLDVEQGDDFYDDAIADAVTTMVFAKVAELRRVLHLEGA